MYVVAKIATDLLEWGFGLPKADTLQDEISFRIYEWLLIKVIAEWAKKYDTGLNKSIDELYYDSGLSQREFHQELLMLAPAVLQREFDIVIKNINSNQLPLATN